jgi:hypothetical protein
MSKGKIITFVVFGVIAVGAIVGLIVGFVDCRTRPPDPLLEVCWVNGEARYVKGSEVDHGPCGGAEELAWPAKQVPITVEAVSPQGKVLGEGEGRRRSVEAAVRDINARLGFELFRMGARGSDPVAALVRLGAAIEAGEAPGQARHFRADGRVRCEAQIAGAVASERLEYIVVHHELLHCAGLAHTDTDNGAMAPLAFDDTLEPDLVIPWISDSHREQLRARYMRP